MFTLGDLVVFKDGHSFVLEVGSLNSESDCDVWNESDYFLAVYVYDLRRATVEERNLGYRISNEA